METTRVLCKQTSRLESPRSAMAHLSPFSPPSTLALSAFTVRPHQVKELSTSVVGELSEQVEGREGVKERGKTEQDISYGHLIKSMTKLRQLKRESC